MSGDLINLVKYEVQWVHSEELDSITIGGLGISSVKRANVGAGVFYFYRDAGRYSRQSLSVGPWLSELSILHETPITPMSLGPLWTRVTLDKVVRFPCTGIITSSEQGYLIAPSLKIEVSEGKNIAMMLLSPRTTPHQISVEKQALSIPSEEVNLLISSESGQLQCTGNLSGSSFKAARLVLNRNPHLPVYRAGYNEELANLAEPGTISAAWQPVARSFEECLFIFYPSTIQPSEFKTLTAWLGVPDEDILNPNATAVVGDGPGTDYKLRLVFDRRFRRSLADETLVNVT